MIIFQTLLHHSLSTITCHATCLTCSGQLATQCLSCPDYRYFASLQCRPCAVNCLRCGGPNYNACLSCPPGYTAQGSICKHGGCLAMPTCLTCAGTTPIKCLTCFTGYILFSGICCAEGCISCATIYSSICTGCVSHNYLAGYCFGCHPRCDQCNGAGDSRCTGCISGLVLVNMQCCHSTCQGCLGPTDVQCTACDPMVYALVSGRCCHLTCMDCSGSTPTDCTACLSGPLSSGMCCHSSCLTCSAPALDSQCLTCSAECVWDAGKCICCRSGCSQCTGPGSGECTLCNSGLGLSEGNCCHPSCVTCSDSSPTGCLSCSTGFFYESMCVTSCPPNSISASNTCQPCHSSCNTCQFETTNCLSCFSGMTLVGTHCDCPFGYFESNGQCVACAGGCLSCPRGGCVACAAGMALVGEVCSCGVGRFVVGSRCQDCVPDCLACISTTVCSACQFGFFLWSSSQCRTCSPSCHSCRSQLVCDSCTMPFLLFTGSCFDKCPTGSYSAIQVCVACRDSCVSCNSNGCLQCADKLFFEAGNCVANCRPENFAGFNTCNECKGPCFHVKIGYQDGVGRPYKIKLKLEIYGLALNRSYFESILQVNQNVKITQETERIFGLEQECNNEFIRYQVSFQVPQNQKTFFGQSFSKSYEYEWACIKGKDFLPQLVSALQTANDVLYKLPVPIRGAFALLTPGANSIQVLLYSDKPFSPVLLQPFLLLSLGHLPHRREWNAPPQRTSFTSRVLRISQFEWWEVPGIGLGLVMLLLMLFKLISYLLISYKFIKTYEFYLSLSLLLRATSEIVVQLCLPTLLLLALTGRLQPAPTSVLVLLVSVSYGYVLFCEYHSVDLRMLKHYDQHWALDEELTEGFIFGKVQRQEFLGFWGYLTERIRNFLFLGHVCQSCLLGLTSFWPVPILILYGSFSLAAIALLVRMQPYRQPCLNTLQVLRQTLTAGSAVMIVYSWAMYEKNNVTAFHLLAAGAVVAMLGAMVIGLGTAVLIVYHVFSKEVRNEVLKLKKQCYLEMLVNSKLQRVEIDQAVVEANMNELCEMGQLDVDYPVYKVLFYPTKAVLQHNCSIVVNQRHEFFLQQNFKPRTIKRWLTNQQKAVVLQESKSRIDSTCIKAIHVLERVKQENCGFGEIIQLQKPTKTKTFFYDMQGKKQTAMEQRVPAWLETLNLNTNNSYESK